MSASSSLIDVERRRACQDDVLDLASSVSWAEALIAMKRCG